MAEIKETLKTWWKLGADEGDHTIALSGLPSVHAFGRRCARCADKPDTNDKPAA